MRRLRDRLRSRDTASCRRYCAGRGGFCHCQGSWRCSRRTHPRRVRNCSSVSALEFLRDIEGVRCPRGFVNARVYVGPRDILCKLPGTERLA